MDVVIHSVYYCLFQLPRQINNTGISLSKYGTYWIFIYCVLGYDIALAGLGYITSSDTKLRSYILQLDLLAYYIYITYN